MYVVVNVSPPPPSANSCVAWCLRCCCDFCFLYYNDVRLYSVLVVFVADVAVVACICFCVCFFRFVVC